MSTTDTLYDLLTTPQTHHFHPDFLARFSLPKIQQAVTAAQRRSGVAQQVQAAGPDLYTVTTPQGTFDVLARFDESGRVTALQLPTPPFNPLYHRMMAAALLGLHLLIVRGAVLTWSAPTSLTWLTDLLPSVALTAAFLATSTWLQLSTWMRPVLWAALLALLLSTVHAVTLPLGQPGVLDTIFAALVLAVTLPLTVQGIRGRRRPSDAVPLGPVLAGGKFLVVHGGSTDMLNYHVAHPHMRYAVDYVGVGRLGCSARGILPVDPARYVIFGADVLAPLTGQVVAAQGSAADLPVPHSDPLQPAGNHVVIRADLPDGRTVHVLLAHLRQGSVRVQVGDTVQAGDLIGQVGNSGNTSEPHLHLGVNVDAQISDPLGGEGVPFMVDGRFPVRGQVIRA